MGYSRVMDTLEDLTRQVMQLARRIRRARTEALAPYGLTPHQARAFIVIARHPHRHPGVELRLTDLAQRLRIAPRSATEVVDALCKRELVQRENSSQDRRATSLTLTRSGQGLLADVRAASPATEVFAALNDRERAALGVLLSKLLDSVDR